jgi:transmembrane secretion effector
MRLIPPGWRVLRLADYRRLWLAHAGSVVGDGFHSIAITWLVFQTLGGGPQALAFLGIAYAIPGLALGILSGTIVDRLDRRRVMVATDLVRASLVALLAILVGTGHASIAVVITMGVALVLASLFFGPAQGAALPSYVPPDEIVAANALLQATRQGAQLITPAIGGVLFMTIGPVGLFLVDAASFVWSALMIARITPAAAVSAPPARRPLLQEAADGLRFIAGHAPSRLVVLLGAANQLFASGPFRVMIPAWVAAVLAGGAAEYGAIMSALAAGLVTGSLAVGSLRGRLPMVDVIVTGIFVDGVFWAAFGLSGTLALAIACFFALGVANAILNTAFASFLQTTVPTAMRGRAFATFYTAINLTAPVSLAVTGLAATIAGPVALITLSGVGLMGVGVLALAASLRERRVLTAPTPG